MKIARDIDNVIVLNAIRRRRACNSVGNHVHALLTWRHQPEVVIYYDQHKSAGLCEELFYSFRVW